MHPRGFEPLAYRFVVAVSPAKSLNFLRFCDQAPREFGTLYLEKIRQWFVQARDRAGLLADALRRILR